MDALEALRQVRKELPPPSRAKADEKKYRREAARQTVRKEIEREVKKE
ncbi:MAG: hypothetical protein HY268_32480 [Deltaproteobacteria bacterium]|nr:hypothetical protein [Deltaproteobacteria bacterium]